MNLKLVIRSTWLLQLVAVAIFLFLSYTIRAQAIDSAYLLQQWNASWITVPQASPTGYGVYYFRKGFELTALPATYPVHVSADNRYKLFINGMLVSVGPARGDALHWNFETVDLAPFLQVGYNVVAAQVWNEGPLRMEANISLQTGFILQGGTDLAQAINTNNDWKCVQDSSYTPVKIVVPGYYVAGAGEQVRMQKQFQGWKEPAYTDSNWQNAKAIANGYPKNKVGQGEPGGWQLVPSTLPQMERKQQRLAQLRKVEGMTAPAASFPAEKTALSIPANTTATLLLDQSFLTNAYPTLLFSGGENSIITISYAEALYTKPPIKGNRNEIDGKTLIGRKDIVISNGGMQQEFTTLSWRTYRYLQLQITTKETPLVLEDIYGTFTGFPFQLKAGLETTDRELLQVFDIGWRTARLCAVETYMDCPYYEQLQYIGDARIQGLVSLYNSDDDRLLRNALNQINYSQQPEGLTMSRYPTKTPQYIPPFSLWYVAMLHDYMMYGRDSTFIKNKLPSARQVLHYFQDFQQADGSIKNLPGWNFTDWVGAKEWKSGVRSAGKDGNSALMDLQLLWAYQLVADMETKLGVKEYAALYKQKAEQLKRTVRIKYWDSTRKLFADRSEKDLFSQHANALAILTGLIAGKEATTIGRQLLSDTTLAPASIYFKYYLHQALTKAGLGNDYLNWLNVWRENIKMGLTTWGETSDVQATRSDCHAWGASPNIEFFRTILGIDSDAPGFSKIKIEPHLGNLTTIGGHMPHPNGEITVSYTKSNGHLHAKIQLPPKTTGKFVWKGRTYSLKAGKNTVNM